LRHIWESGVDYASLTTENQTTPNYLANLYDELVVFATARGVLSSKAPQKADIVAALSSAISTPGAPARLAQLNAVTCHYGLVAFPGTPSCPASTLDAGASASDAGAAGSGAGDAGAGHVDGGNIALDESSTAGSGGCNTARAEGSAGTLGLALLGAVSALAWGVRKRRPRMPR